MPRWPYQRQTGLPLQGAAKKYIVSHVCLRATQTRHRHSSLDPNQPHNSPYEVTESIRLSRTNLAQGSHTIVRKYMVNQQGETTEYMVRKRKLAKFDLNRRTV